METSLYSAAGALQKISLDNIVSHPNILIAARLWEEDRFRAAMTCYKFMRKIDDLIDDRKGEPEVISCLEKQDLTGMVEEWMECLRREATGNPMLDEVAMTIRRFRIPDKFFIEFARAMVYDINHDGFRSFDDFLYYAEGASNGPASVFLHLCCLKNTPAGIETPPFDIMELARPCALFSYIVHIIRDFQKDQLNNLNYFAEDIMNKYGLDKYSLRRIAVTGSVTEGFRNMIRHYCREAEKFKKETAEVIRQLSPFLDPQYLLSLEVIYDLYLMIYERIDADRGTFTMEELNPTKEELQQRLSLILDKISG